MSGEMPYKVYLKSGAFVGTITSGGTGQASGMVCMFAAALRMPSQRIEYVILDRNGYNIGGGSACC